MLYDDDNITAASPGGGTGNMRMAWMNYS